MTIRKYRQGERCIIVVENCTGETATKVNKLLYELLMDDEASEQQAEEALTETEIPGIEPEDLSEEPAPDVETAIPIETTADLFPEPIPDEEAYNTPVDGPSQTLRGAIQQNDVAAIVKLLTSQRGLPQHVGGPVSRICRTQLRKDLQKRDPDITPVKEIKKFVVAYAPFIESAMKNILSASGFEDSASYFRISPEYIVQDAYRRLIDVCLREI